MRSKHQHTMRMKTFVAAALTTAVLGLISPAMGHAQETEGGTFQLNVGTGYYCGRASTPLYCYGIPVNLGSETGSGGNGSFWIDTYVSGYNKGSGFLLFTGVADLGQATITGNTPTVNPSGQVTALTVVFNGTSNEGEAYTGKMTLTFSYYTARGGGGKGGGSAGLYFICTGGSVQITYSSPGTV